MYEQDNDINYLQSKVYNLEQKLKEAKNELNAKNSKIEELIIDSEQKKSELKLQELVIDRYRTDKNNLNKQLNKLISDSKKNIRITVYKYAIYSYGVAFFIAIIYFLWQFTLENPDIFKVTEETISFVTNFYNVIILFLIPLFFGSLSAIARISISGLSLIKSSKLIFASGIMAAFSWVGIKSKLFIALLTPYIEAKPNVSEAIKDIDITEFYSMVLVAILVGMFASNLFVFIDNKTKMLKLESKVNAEDEMKISKETSKKED